ncbi:hypothetical protein [Demequina aurantiaca]|uniref:hypothetical protein n=1 Tax=Demequina aurantiaca TaxID=676200 RepID=UPI003D34D328
MTRRLAAPLTAAVAAIVVLLLALAVASPASAAQLSVSASHPVINTAARCSTATAATTAPASSTASTTLRISSMPSACAGLPVSVSIVGTGGTILATGTLASAATGTNNVTVSAYNTANVASVGVFVNTWWLNTTWTAPATGPYSCVELTAWPGNSWEAPASYGTPTGNSCTVSYTNFDAWGGTPPKHFNLYFTVSGVTTGNWRVTIDFADPYFQGLLPTNISGNGNPLAAPGYACSQLPIFVGQANLTWGSSNRMDGYLSGSAVGNAGSICS